MTTKTYLSHWQYDKSFLIYRASLLAAGIEPLKIEKYMNDEMIQYEMPVDDIGLIKLIFGAGHPVINVAKKLEVEGWERAERYCKTLFKYADDHDDANFKISPNYISRESVVRWAISIGLKEFPLGCPIEEDTNHNTVTAQKPLVEHTTDNLQPNKNVEPDSKNETLPAKNEQLPNIDTPIESLNTPQNEFYSDDLAVAIETWKELFEKGVSDGKTFKQSAEEIIRRKRKEWYDTRVIRVARIVNCNPGTTQERKPVSKS